MSYGYKIEDKALNMTKVCFDIENSKAWEKFLENSNLTAEAAMQLFVEQCCLFSSLPFETYNYGKNALLPSGNIDFSQKPLCYVHPLKRAVVDAILSSDIPVGIEKIVLFGSSATPHCHENSDTDLCFVGSYTIDDEARTRWLRNLWRLEYGPKDIKFYTLEQFENADSPLLKSIRRKGIIIYDTNNKQLENG